ncbi:Fur family transcriptional regulator [Portibacter marinus]|uniref:Fur family transcriptional regulator n=1 Tax=Portibacter marinus TaxID=2898660 RepID=UPI001F2BCDD5|nr:transcriptional repressor [Portibacter marinus]
MERVIQFLEEKKIRITPMRQLLLEFFMENDGTFGLQELEDEFPKSDRITIYRTLKTFEDKGIIHSINNGIGEVKYALCNEHCTPVHHIDQHPHFQCERCEQITCIDSLVIPEMRLPSGFLKKEMELMIKGLCPSCS